MHRGLMAFTATSAAFPSIRLPAFAPTPQQSRSGANLRVKRGTGGLLCVLFGAVLTASQVAVIPAHADEQQLQRQIDAMKRQLEAMQRELAQTRKQSAQPRACRSRAFLPGLTAFTSRWPARLSRLTEHGASITRFQTARAIRRSQIRASRCRIRRFGASGSFG